MATVNILWRYGVRKAIISLIRATLLILFIAGFFILLPVLLMVEVNFWLFSDEQDFGWLIRDTWKCKDMI